MCVAVAAALGTFGTAAQATFYAGDFDPFTGTFSLNVSDSCSTDGCTIELLPGLFIDSTVFTCCWTSPGQPVIATNETFSGGNLVAFDSGPIPLSFSNDELSVNRVFGNDALPCDNPSLVFTSTPGFDEQERPGYVAQLVCAGDVSDDAIYHLTRVPEPGTLALILGGLGAAWLTRRRKAAS